MNVYCRIMADENDPVVCERTVMLSRKLHDHLVLLQYPVRSAERTYDKAHVLATRVKPGQQAVELELAMDTENCHYSVTGARDTGCVDTQVCKQLELNYNIDNHCHWHRPALNHMHSLLMIGCFL